MKKFKIVPFSKALELSDYVNKIASFPSGGYYKRPEILRVEGVNTPHLSALKEMQGKYVAASNIEQWEVLSPILVDQGVILTLDGFAILETLADYPSQIETQHISLRDGCIELKELPKEVNLNGHLLKKKGQTNYGHWLVELLVRHYYLQQVVGISVPVIIHKAIPDFVRELYYESLDLLPVSNIQELGYEPVIAEKVFYLTGMSAHPSLKTTILSQMAAYLRNKVGVRESWRKLYVTRSGSHKRAIVNQAEVESFFTTKGFEVVEPEQLSFAEQIALFGEAEEVFGIMGAAMCNALWSAPTARVGYIASEAMDGKFYIDQESVLGRESFNIFFCELAGVRERLFDDITVDVGSLEKWVDSIS